MLRYINQTFLFLACLAPDPDPAPGAGADPAKALADLQAKFDAQAKEIEALKGKQNPNPDPGQKSLAEKAEEERKSKESNAEKERNMESAMKFDIERKEWLKTNASLLPKNIEGIFTAADKEKYSSSIEKVNDIKVGVIQEFFAVQANLDLLTGSQKVKLDEFLKSTKDRKQESAQQIYDSIFEPTFETLKKVKRAEQQGKGHAPQSDTATAYKERMMARARKHFLGEKK